MYDYQALALAAHDELCAWLDGLNARARFPVSFAAAKHVAAISSVLEYEAGLSREVALDAATALAQQRLKFSRGSFKKNRSTASAILQFGMTPGDRSTLRFPPQRSVVFAAVLRVNVDAVSRARAQSLGGARGGRPANERNEVLDLVRGLLRKSMQDPDAAKELELIRNELDLIAGAA